MGAYLSHPKTDKASTDEFNDFLVVGASSMQGWRNSQEDAHNSILSFDKNTSFFAVYDGHGGAEVAQYCADKLPEFLKNLESYKYGRLEEALKEAFLGFDKTLLDPLVVSILKILAGEHNFVDGDAEDDEDDEEDLVELQEESHLPLNKVLEKYTGIPQKDDLINTHLEEASTCLGSKYVSPYMRVRRAAAVAAEAVNKAVMDPTTKPEGSSTSAAAAAYLNHSKTISETHEDNPTGSNSNCKSQICVDLRDAPNGSASNTSDVNLNGSDGTAEAVVESSNKTLLIKVAQNNPKSTTILNSENIAESIPKNISAVQDESTDEDDDYVENDVCDNNETLADDSSDDINTAESEDEDNEDQDDEDEDETDEDQMANDNFCTNMIEEPGKDSGCTAVVCLLHGRDLFVANAGDSRCVVSRNGKAIEMSLDHKPEDEEESARIVKAGGRVTLDGRVNGGLNLSRAIGDHAYKNNLDLPAEAQMISALPDIRRLVITPEDEFMILACDGIWNYMSSKEAVDFIRLRLQNRSLKLSQICEELFDHCLAPNTMGDGTGCDNMTAVIVKFQDKMQELQATIDPTKTEDVQQNICTVNVTAHNDQSSLKRCASPDADADAEDSELKNANKSKRLKTEENVLDPVDATSEVLINTSTVEPKESTEVTVVVSSS
ncbi:hypothetical protein KR018_007036 [Drosophila ironensis]|nr:hypothetical protein KR018_007036 [Drosophila ironensis]